MRIPVVCAGSIAVCCVLASQLSAGRAGEGQPGIVAPFEILVVGDTIPVSLTGLPGDAVRGRAIVLDRAVGNCLICHQVPVPAETFQGNIGPDLRGVGGRLGEAQIRLRVVDQSRLNPATMMPPFYRVDDLTRVAARFKGLPVLSASAIEDVVAYLVSLKQ